jgi:hypothetical protein
LLLHILAIMLLSFPGETKLGDPARWREPRTQAQIVLWAERLRGWGWQVSNEDFEAKLWGLTQRYLALRRAAITPVAPYAQLAPQGWGMFKAPPLEPSTITIEVREGRSPWRPLYLARSDEHDWNSRLLDHNRFRKQIGRTSYDAALLRQMALWLARRAFDELPEVTDVRVRLVRITSLPPERRRAGEVPPRRTERQEHIRRGASL